MAKWVVVFDSSFGLDVVMGFLVVVVASFVGGGGGGFYRLFLVVGVGFFILFFIFLRWRWWVLWVLFCCGMVDYIWIGGNGSGLFFG